MTINYVLFVLNKIDDGLSNHRRLLPPCLFPSCRIAGITDDLSSPHRPVRLLTRSQSSTCHVSLACVFPSYFRSSSLLFPVNIHPHHFPRHAVVSVCDLFGSLCHPRCPSFDLTPTGILFGCISFVPDSLKFASHSAHPTQRGPPPTVSLAYGPTCVAQ